MTSACFHRILTSSLAILALLTLLQASVKAAGPFNLPDEEALYPSPQELQLEARRAHYRRFYTNFFGTPSISDELEPLSEYPIQKDLAFRRLHRYGTEYWHKGNHLASTWSHRRMLTSCADTEPFFFCLIGKINSYCDTHLSGKTEKEICLGHMANDLLS